MSKTNYIEGKVSKYIQDSAYMHNGSTCVVGLSGGADSITLTLILLHLGYQVIPIHCNFKLRGDEADRDETFCADFCQKENLPLRRVHFDTCAMAEKYKISIEMAARALRYNYFRQVCDEIKRESGTRPYLCVGHHQDDNIETFFINLLRGSGLDGLTAISPSIGDIRRPLLCLSHQEILEYLEEQGQAFVTDSSNLVDDVVRNKVRLHVLPLLESINPAARSNIAKSIAYLNQANDLLESLLSNPSHKTLADCKVTTDNASYEEQKMLDDGAIHLRCNAIAEFGDLASYVLHRLIGEYGFHGDVIHKIVSSFHDAGKIWSSKTHQLAMDRSYLTLIPLEAIERVLAEKPVKIPESGVYNIHEHKVSIKIINRPEGFQPSREAHKVTLDAEKVNFPLTYRRTEQGDRFHPFGMKGSKLVSDYLTDKKTDYLTRLCQHILVDANNNIIWLEGLRTSEICKVTEKTQQIIEIEVRKNDGHINS